MDLNLLEDGAIEDNEDEFIISTGRQEDDGGMGRIH